MQLRVQVEALKCLDEITPFALRHSNSQLRTWLTGLCAPLLDQVNLTPERSRISASILDRAFASTEQVETQIMNIK